VLHGASSVLPQYVEKINKYGGNIGDAKGVPEEMLRKATTMGITKINIDTDLRLAMTASIRVVFAESPQEFDPRKYLGKGREEITNLVRHKMKDVLGSSIRYKFQGAQAPL